MVQTRTHPRPALHSTHLHNTPRPASRPCSSLHPMLLIAPHALHHTHAPHCTPRPASHPMPHSNSIHHTYTTPLIIPATPRITPATVQTTGFFLQKCRCLKSKRTRVCALLAHRILASTVLQFSHKNAYLCIFVVVFINHYQEFHTLPPYGPMNIV